MYIYTHTHTYTYTYRHIYNHTHPRTNIHTYVKLFVIEIPQTQIPRRVATSQLNPNKSEITDFHKM